MLLRLALAIVHSLLAALMATGAVFVLGQMLLNRAWEQGFYGQVGPTTQTYLATSVLMLVLSVVLPITVLAWIRGWRVAGALLAGWGTFLLFTPAWLLGVLTLVVVLMDAWARRQHSRDPAGT